jgi:AraC-like DNA-binding protein
MQTALDGVASIKLFRFGADVMQPGARYSPDAAARLEVWLALSGAAKVSTDGLEIRLDAGQGIIIQSQTAYDFEVVGTAPHMLTWCESEPLGVAALPGMTPRLFPITTTMTTLIDLGLAAERRPVPIRDALGLYLGHALLVEVVARIQDPRDERRPRATADRLRALIAADPAKNWTLEVMARAVGLSSRSLNRKLALDGSPSANGLLWGIRVRLGAELLVRSNAPCADIADLCGFQSPPHFTRRIKELTDMTPIAIRQWALSAPLGARADFFQSLERRLAERAA